MISFHMSINAVVSVIVVIFVVLMMAMNESYSIWFGLPSIALVVVLAVYNIAEYSYLDPAKRVADQHLGL